jgi:hypothetical protein
MMLHTKNIRINIVFILHIIIAARPRVTTEIWFSFLIFFLGAHSLKFLPPTLPLPLPHDHVGSFLGVNLVFLLPDCFILGIAAFLSHK